MASRRPVRFSVQTSVRLFGVASDCISVGFSVYVWDGEKLSRAEKLNCIVKLALIFPE